jgi:glutaryl-CoA dehydrogenase (non-decarboxylating)
VQFELSREQQTLKESCREFTLSEIAPFADDYDKNEALPGSIIKKISEQQYIASLLPEQYGGKNADMTEFGIINEEIGRGCSSVRSLLTVHAMVTSSLYRWGSKEQKHKWLYGLGKGNKIGAFALSEPDVGSDGKSVKVELTQQGDGFILNGHKKWITFGQIADLFLVIAQINGSPIACLVEKQNPGLKIEAINGLMGTRATMLAELKFEDCKISHDDLVGGAGFGFSAIAMSALDIGRFSVATGSVGIAQACLDCSLDYASERKQFGSTLSEFQLIRRKLTNMIVQIKAARLLCYQAAYQHERNHPKSTKEIMFAKYYASTIANDIARDAVQVHGGNGILAGYKVERFFRDAKIMEIIEGTSEMNQIVLGTRNAI